MTAFICPVTNVDDTKYYKPLSSDCKILSIAIATLAAVAVGSACVFFSATLVGTLFVWITFRTVYVWVKVSLAEESYLGKLRRIWEADSEELFKLYRFYENRQFRLGGWTSKDLKIQVIAVAVSREIDRGQHGPFCRMLKEVDLTAIKTARCTLAPLFWALAFTFQRDVPRVVVENLLSVSSNCDPEAIGKFCLVAANTYISKRETVNFGVGLIARSEISSFSKWIGSTRLQEVLAYRLTNDYIGVLPTPEPSLFLDGSYAKALRVVL